MLGRIHTHRFIRILFLSFLYFFAEGVHRFQLSFFDFFFHSPCLLIMLFRNFCRKPVLESRDGRGAADWTVPLPRDDRLER